MSDPDTRKYMRERRKEVLKLKSDFEGATDINTKQNIAKIAWEKRRSGEFVQRQVNEILGVGRQAEIPKEFSKIEILGEEVVELPPGLIPPPVPAPVPPPALPLTGTTPSPTVAKTTMDPGVPKPLNKPRTAFGKAVESLKKTVNAPVNYAKKVLAPQTPNVDLALNEAITNMSKQEVEAQLEYSEGIKESLKSGEPVMVFPEKGTVVENTDVIESSYKKNTPENVITELNIESVGNVVRAEQAGNPTSIEEVTESLGMTEQELLDTVLLEEPLEPEIMAEMEIEGTEGGEGTVSTQGMMGAEDTGDTVLLEEPETDVAVDESILAGMTDDAQRDPSIIDDVQRDPEQADGEQVPITGAKLKADKPVPAKYHKESVKLFLGSAEKPIYDLELLNNIMTTNYTKEMLTKMIDDIITNFGSKMFVYARKSSTKEEFNELVQIQFCIMRNLHRGTRAKTAEIPISSLIQFGSRLTNPAPAVQFNNVTNTPKAAPLNTTVRPTQGAFSAPKTGRVGLPGVLNPVRISQADAIDKVAEAYDYGPYDPFGKPRVRNDVAKDTLITHPSINGPNSGVDPTNNGPKGLGDFKLAVSKKCKTVSMKG